MRASSSPRRATTAWSSRRRSAATPVNLGAELRRNWASASGGATSQGGESNQEQGCGSAAAIDQRLGTTWSAHQPTTPAQMVVTLPATVNVRSFSVDPGEGCLDDWEAAAQTVRIETAPTAGGPWIERAVPIFDDDDRHRVSHVAAQADGVKYVRVTILSTQGPSDFRDISEFGVHSAPPPAVTPTPTPTPSPTATPIATASPDPTAVPDGDPHRGADGDAGPDRHPAREAALHAPVLGQARAQGPRRLCRELRRAGGAEGRREDREAARVRADGRAPIARRWPRGTTSFTVSLSSKVRRALLRKVKSFKATLTVSSGTVTTTKKVTVKR